MSYELNVSTEQSRHALNGEIGQLHGEVKRLRGTLLAAAGTLAAALIIGAVLVAALLKIPGTPSPQPIAIYAASPAPSPATAAATQSHVLCFRFATPYVTGESEVCEKRKCSDSGWMLVNTVDRWNSGETLDTVLSKQSPSVIRLAMVIGGHDETPVRPNAKYDSNLTLALKRAEDASKRLPTILQRKIPESIKRAASSNTTQVCPDALVTDNADQRRTPTLVLVVDESGAGPQEHAP
ncbi:MAG TPA: hypothetical protein VN153_02100 [Tahibacter sp.]|nr:hypothetical protein [Tahibacter sp.]